MTSNPETITVQIEAPGFSTISIHLAPATSTAVRAWLNIDDDLNHLGWAMAVKIYGTLLDRVAPTQDHGWSKRFGVARLLGPELLAQSEIPGGIWVDIFITRAAATDPSIEHWVARGVEECFRQIYDLPDQSSFGRDSPSVEQVSLLRRIMAAGFKVPTIAERITSSRAGTYIERHRAFLDRNPDAETPFLTLPEVGKLLDVEWLKLRRWLYHAGFIYESGIPSPKGSPHAVTIPHQGGTLTKWNPDFVETWRANLAEILATKS